MEELAKEIELVRNQLESGGEAHPERLLAVEGLARREMAGARPGLFGRLTGFSPAALVAIVQLVLLVLELVRQLRKLRKE